MSLKYATHHALGGTAQDGGLEQNEQELLMLTDFIKKKGIKSFLEIGIAAGFLQRYMMDLGLDCYGITPEKRESYADINITYGKSQDKEVIDFAKDYTDEHGLFDMIFVDGDHSYQAVKADYQNYKGLCKYMVFHDITGRLGTPDVKHLWDEVKYHHKYLEFIADKWDECSGIGIIIIGQE